MSVTSPYLCALSAADDVCLDFRVCEGFQQIASEEVWYLPCASSPDPHSLLRSCSLLRGSRSSCKLAPHFYWPAAPCRRRKQTWITCVGSLQILSWRSPEADFCVLWGSHTVIGFSCFELFLMWAWAMRNACQTVCAWLFVLYCPRHWYEVEQELT